MGQSNLQKIQSSIATLHQCGDITLKQAQFFMKEYLSNGQKIKDINYFLESSSIDLFMKYYIHCTYPNKSTTLQPSQITQINNQLSMIEQVIQKRISEMNDRTKSILGDLRDIYLSQNEEIVGMRQKIKDILINILQIESYKYYYYHNGTIKQTNSKILYFYETAQGSQIYKYVKQEISIQEEGVAKNNNKLDEVVQKMYPNTYHLAYQFRSQNYMHVVLFEINRQKWKYSQCLSDEKVKKFFYFIAAFLVEQIFLIYDTEVKLCQFHLRNLYKNFILNALEHFLALESLNLEKSFPSHKTHENKKYVEYLNSFKQTKQKLLSKIRTWKLYTKSQQGKILYFHFNEELDLQFFYSAYLNDLNIAQIQQQSRNFNTFIKYIFNQDKKVIKKINKILKEKPNNRKIVLGKGLSMLLYKNNDSLKLQGLSLIIELNVNSKLDNTLKSQSRTQDKDFSLDNDKYVIKRLKNQQPIGKQAGWFKEFIKSQHEMHKNNQFPYQRKNNIKLPKLNRSFNSLKLSKFKIAQNLEELREYIDINDENLNVLDYNSTRLQALTIKVFAKLEYFCNLPHLNDQFPNFLREMHLQYEKNQNSFHNFTHAVNVMHTCYLFCNADKNNQLLNSFNKFVIIFSGLCHDVGHTGFTNLFEIARQSDIAILYNNKSPLENYHASRTFQILRKPQNNFLSSLTEEEYRKFRELTISNILFTDIKEHFGLLKKFQTEKNTITSNNVTLLAAMIVHSSDFGGSVKNFEICKAWSLLVNQQFSKQYREEQRLNLPLTPFMKDLNIMSVLAKNQMGFLKVIVQPLYKQMTQFYGDQHLSKLLVNVEDNIENWQKVMEQVTGRE